MVGDGDISGVTVATSDASVGSDTAVADCEVAVASSVGLPSITGVLHPITTASNAIMPTTFRGFSNVIRRRLNSEISSITLMLGCRHYL